MIGDSGLRLKSLWSGSGWNVELLRYLVSEQLVQKITRSDVKLKKGEDKCVWAPSVDGNFSTKSAWQLVRKKGSLCSWRRWLWHDVVPNKMSFCCWRVRRKLLPVDEAIMQLGIPMVSKCSCCAKPNMETLDHVLCEGEGPKKIWSYFASICGIWLPRVQTWDGMMIFWRRCAASSS